MVFLARKLISHASLASHMGKRAFSSSSVNAQLASLRGQNFMSTAQLTTDELTGLLAKAQEFKATYSDPATKATAPKPLTNEICSMIFQKRSTRTRISSEVGMHLLGGKGLFLSSDDIQLGVNETFKDTALVLSRFNSIILARVYRHKDIEELGSLATVPVINALSDKYHPLQMLADYLTVKEHFGKFEGLTFAWVGDGNNVLHDYMLAAPKVGANIQIATPVGYEPDQDIVEETKRLAKIAGTKVVMTTDPIEAVKGANVVSTDTWISMGQEEESKKRLRDFAGYQVTNKMLENAANDHIFLHCLPRHQDEVHDEVFYGDRSLVFDEAENRLWTVMAVYASLLGKF
ncbi:hypothetical protein BBO99_00005613 [Phytophthora kernoviae]|uniref:ornithine carbamoyltransferase n=2 Tax=Phytophthora kernoviae TaxID=325452 RepID=A0A3R7MUG7_9STRA|nr:hypothetical protein G195_006481 [Phytophthora kernoviae 00238/432]KAG2522993.1 hypothetical protein JM16_005549 [Phytophthora kernoviae]KAG2524682.1 hypothetical protein JM18_005282 [Phytophthora kernoviae]RLN38206.1 hypothetical protein BBI17_005925 [Phytophthora kernoviae]RLN78948.1 hypothetical protein BBO99_00005613 [Phytophthora kernoviae]